MGEREPIGCSKVPPCGKTPASFSPSHSPIPGWSPGPLPEMTSAEQIQNKERGGHAKPRRKRLECGKHQALLLSRHSASRNEFRCQDVSG